MPRLTEELQALESDLAKYPGSDADSLLNRRLVLRKAFTGYGDARYEEGHRDGLRDAGDARREAKKRAADRDGTGERAGDA